MADLKLLDARARLQTELRDAPLVNEAALRVFDQAVEQGQDPHEALQDVMAAAYSAVQNWTEGAGRGGH